MGVVVCFGWCIVVIGVVWYVVVLVGWIFVFVVVVVDVGVDFGVGF